MKQYQYKTISAFRSKTDEILKEFGLEGWELCATILEGSGEEATIHLFFKKEI